jgi:hypothetical protein
LQVSRLMGMGADENVADQIAGKLEDMLAVVRKVRVNSNQDLGDQQVISSTQARGLVLC